MKESESSEDRLFASGRRRIHVHRAASTSGMVARSDLGIIGGHECGAHSRDGNVNSNAKTHVHIALRSQESCSRQRHCAQPEGTACQQ